MKKKLFLMLICCVMSMSVFAYITEYKDANNVTWKVTLNSNTMEATIEQGVEGNTEDVVVPETITIGEQKYIVTAIGYYAFAAREDIETISLPATITTIVGESWTTINGIQSYYGVFSHNKNLESVDFNDAPCTIGDHAFYNCSALTFVDDLSKCTSIGDCAFKNCSALTSVGDLSQCTSIGYAAFDGCSSLTSVGDLAQCTSIDSYTFRGCSSLALVDLSQCTSIDVEAFYGCTALTLVDLSQCTSIGSSAFRDCSALTSVGDLSQCTSIGIDAFNGCSALTSVGDLSQCTSIGSSAFYDCSSLTSVGDLSKCTSIGQQAFYKCSALTSVGDLSQCTSIGIDAFADCSALASVGDLSQCKSIGGYAFYNCSALISVGDLEKCTSIGSYAFSGCSALISIGDLSKCTSIGDKAFCGCSTLISIGDLPECTSIGTRAFYNCSALTSVGDLSKCTSISEEAFIGCYALTSVGDLSQCTSIGEKAFYYCYALTSVGDLSQYTSIGESAFYYCSALTSVGDLSKCTSIGQSAFYYCSALTSVGDLSKCTSIGEYAFYDCSALTSVGDLSQCISIGGYAFSGCSALTSVGDLSQCTSIGYYAFEGCSALISIGDLSQCISIGDKAFCGCSALTSVGDLSKCTSIGYYAFEGCSALISIGDLSQCISIGGYAFEGCSALTSVGDLSQCISIGGYAFEGCSALTSVGDLSKCTSIGSYAFSGCSALTSVGDLSQCTSIEGSAFSYCSSLTSVGDLSQCTSIGGSAFNYCYALNKIVLSSETMATAGSNVTSECTSVLVPESLLVAYRTADNWKDMAYRILPIEVNTEYDVVVTASDNSSAIQAAIGEEKLANVIALKVKGSINGYDVMIMRNKMLNLHSIDLSEANIVEDANHYCYYDSYYTKNNVLPEYVFYEHHNISSVKMPVSITEIGQYAFNSCSNLYKIEIPENVLTIGSRAFTDCYQLQSVVIPDNVMTIGNRAFTDCDKLQKVIIGKSVKTIGYEAFYSCGSLQKVVIGKSVKTIDKEAFYDCSALSDLTLGNAVETIESDAFCYCKLKTLTIPSSVKSIGSGAFSGNQLEKVYATSVLPIAISQDAFSAWTTATLYVPKDDETDWNATYNAYYWHTQWSQFVKLQSWTPQYEYFYLEDDYEMESGEIPGTDEKDPDADLGEESGFIVDEGAHQDMGEVNIDSDGESGGSIIAEGGSEESDEGNVTMDKLNIKIAVQPNKWYFFCFPFDIAKEAITCDANYVFRHYDGKSRAEHGNSGWKNVTESEGDYLKAGKGYIFQCDKSTDLVLTIDNPAFNGKNKKSPGLDANASNNAQDANWNFVGNPFLSYFNLDDLQYNAPVTVWNGSTYEALRPGDDDYSFHPFQAFFIQKPYGVDDFEFYARGRETKKQSEKNQANAKAMRAKKAPAADRKLINLIITDGENVDKTRVVFNGKKSDTYEMDCDAAKFMSTANVPQIYTLDNKNVKYAINERPSGSVKLGYVATKAGTLTIAVARMEQTVSIKDNETGTITPLTDGYSFETEAGTFNERFVLLLGDPTGIKELASPESSIEGQDLYNVNGVKVGSNYEGVVIARDKKYIRK